LEASIPADLSYPLTKMLPSGPPEPVAGKLDRRALSPFPWGLDNLWTGLTARRVELRWPDLRLRATYSFTEAARQIVAASVEQNGAIAIEPVTHATDGFRLLADGEPGGIDVLQPGESLSVSYTLTVARE
jgi:aldose 1-epimerase